MTQFGVQPRMAGSKFFEPTRPIAKVLVPPPRTLPGMPAIDERSSNLLRAIDSAVRGMDSAVLPEEDAIGDALNEFRPPSMTVIAERVAARHGFSLLDLQSDRRGKKLVLARHEAFWLCVKRTKNSIAAIGRFFRRDHTTVLHGIFRHEERLAKGVVDG